MPISVVMYLGWQRSCNTQLLRGERTSGNSHSNSQWLSSNLLCPLQCWSASVGVSGPRSPEEDQDPGAG